MNKVIIGTRNIGKTTFLMNKINKAVEMGRNFAILDSATDHRDKSLIFKFIKEHDNFHIISPTNVNDIVVPTDKNNYYSSCLESELFKEMLKNKNKVICVDLAYFLEKGYEYKDRSDFAMAKKCRLLYNYLSQQASVCLMALVNENVLPNLIVFSDEIEFPKCEFNICEFQSDKVKFLSSVHPEDATGTFYESFVDAEFIAYKGETL